MVLVKHNLLVTDCNKWIHAYVLYHKIYMIPTCVHVCTFGAIVSTCTEVNITKKLTKIILRYHSDKQTLYSGPRDGHCTACAY